MENKYYLVTTNCGFNYKGNKMITIIPVFAKSRKHVFEVLKKHPAVRRNPRYVILDITEITYEHYLEIKNSVETRYVLSVEEPKRKNVSVKPVFYNKNHKERQEYITRKNRVIENDLRKLVYSY